MAKIDLAPEIIDSFNSALTKLTGHRRRAYAGELCEKFFDNSPREMEKVLKISRSMVRLGLHERRSGIRCLDAYSMRGTKKKKKRSLN